VTASLFDYNGVLADDETVHLAAFRDVLRPLGLDITEREYWDTYLGFDDRAAFEHALRVHGRDHGRTEVERLIDEKRPCYLERAKGQLRFFDGALELLTLRAKVGPIVIVSGALRDEIELGLELLGATKLVSAIVSAQDAERSKPDPQGYQLGMVALQQAGVADPNSAVVFEDSIDGVRAAKACALRCVGIAHTYPKEKLLEAGADDVVEKISDVATALPDLLQPD
jgi:HAD superfamily hydrolase (TIGR01509 family)